MPNRLTAEIIQMLEHIPNAFYALDRNMCFLYANKKIQQLMNKTEDELIGKFIWDIYPASVGSPLYNTLQNTLATQETGYLEEYHKPYAKWFELYAYPSEYGLAIYVNDITGRKEAENRLQILNKVGECLATTHDLEEAVAKVGTLIVPEFADWFTIDWLNKERVELLTMANADAEKLKWGIEYRNRTEIDINLPKPGSVGWVIRLGVPFMLTDVTEEKTTAAAQDAEHAEVLKLLSMQSAMIVPMPYKGRNIGAVTFISSGRNFSEADFTFAKDLGYRIGIAIENHRLFVDAKKELSLRIRMKSS